MNLKFILLNWSIQIQFKDIYLPMYWYSNFLSVSILFIFVNVSTYGCNWTLFFISFTALWALNYSEEWTYKNYGGLN